MSGDAWGFVITVAVLVAMVANLVVWLHWSDGPWWKTNRRRMDKAEVEARDASLRKHIAWSVVAALWPLALPVLAAVGAGWLYRWLRFSLGGEYPG